MYSTKTETTHKIQFNKTSDYNSLFKTYKTKSTFKLSSHTNKVVYQTMANPNAKSSSNLMDMAGNNKLEEE